MPKEAKPLPHENESLFISDGGIETTLIFHEGLDLPDFAAFHLLRNASGRAALQRYFRAYTDIAVRHGVGFVFETPTWRANTDWGERLGYSPSRLAEANRDAVALVRDLRDELENERSPMLISGCVGPRGDGYVPSAVMPAGVAMDYHAAQIDAFAAAGADMITAITMNYASEATGVALAARAAALPAVISFTVETDGRLPTGQELGDAIAQVDEMTGGYPAYYMINCAHPTHFGHLFAQEHASLSRIGGLRANASSKSHAELNESSELDVGDPEELGEQHRNLLGHANNVNLLGGCCGTDHRHVEAILVACSSTHR